jgi:hypothetical protein
MENRLQLAIDQVDQELHYLSIDLLLQDPNNLNQDASLIVVV